MNFKKLALLGVLLLSVKFSSAQLPDSIKQHIDTSLNVLKHHSLYAKKVDWKKIDQQVYEKAKAAKTKSDTFEALKIAFDALGDKHAQYYQYDHQYRLPNKELEARQSDSLKAGWKLGARIVNKMIGDVAYLSIPYMGVSKQADIDKYANWIYDAVADLNKKQPKAWIIDLRLNGGGNIRPMLSGLGMFFEDGIVSYYVDRDGKTEDEAAFKGGEFTIDGKVQANIKNKIAPIRPKKIAVLIGPGTGSSGEGVAVVLQQRKGTKLFGTKSAGVANATNGYVFADDKAYFLISTASIGNKNKKVMPEFVIPDMETKQLESFGNLPEDPAVKAAIKWLK
ncbi:MAG: S41 family peptidase [Pedobacter sp.]|jgi:hypothetical protein